MIMPVDVLLLVFFIILLLSFGISESIKGIISILKFSLVLSFLFVLFIAGLLAGLSHSGNGLGLTFFVPAYSFVFVATISGVLLRKGAQYIEKK